MRAVLAAAALAVVTAAPGFAEEYAPPSLLETAARAAHERAEPGQRWAFTQTIMRGESTLSARFDPSAPEEERWTLISPAEEELTDEQRAIFRDLQTDDAPDAEIVLGSRGKPFSVEEVFGSGVRLLREDADEAVFGYSPSNGVSLAGGDGEDREEDDVSKHLIGEVFVAKDPLDLRSMHIYAEESFKPHPIARITKLDVTILFEETAPDGPLAFQSMNNEISGRALFQAFDESFRIEYSDYARVDGPPLPDEDETDGE